MISKKQRRTKNIYCSYDFTDEVILKKISGLKQATINQKDAMKKYIKEISLVAWVKRDNYQIEAGGELLEGGSTIKIITYFTDGLMNETSDARIYDDISSNTNSWCVDYQNNKYQIRDISKVDNREIYMQIVAVRIAK